MIKTLSQVYRSRRQILLPLIGLVIIASAISLSLGPLPFSELLAGLGSNDSTIKSIIFDIRLPREILAIMVGAALGLSGTSLQAYFRNPLADPYLIGISAGAALGTAVANLLNINFTILGIGSLPWFAFIGALVLALIISALGNSGAGEYVTVRILLAGVALGTLATSITGALLLVTDKMSQSSAISFLTGSISSAHWNLVFAALPVMIIGAVPLLLLARPLDLLLLGEHESMMMGLNTNQLRPIILIATTLLAGAAVAVGGIIAFAGLLVPHIVRMLIGPVHRLLLPASAVAGALFILIVDTLARSILPQQELPLSVLTGFIGVPFFLYLLFRRTGGALW